MDTIAMQTSFWAFTIRKYNYIGIKVQEKKALKIYHIRLRSATVCLVHCPVYWYRCQALVAMLPRSVLYSLSTYTTEQSVFMERERENWLLLKLIGPGCVDPKRSNVFEKSHVFHEINGIDSIESRNVVSVAADVRSSNKWSKQWNWCNKI